MRKIIIPLFILAILAVAGYFGITYYQQQQRAASISSYQTETISRGSLTALVGATGTVRPNQSTTIAWKTSGTVEQVNVREDTVVKVGDILATLKASSLSQNILLAQADLVNSQKALEELQSSSLNQVQAAQTISATEKTIIEAEKALDPFKDKKYDDDLDKARDEIATTKDNLKTAQDDFEPYKDWDPTNDKRKQYEDRLDEAQRKYDDAVRKFELLQLDKWLAEQNLAVAQAKLADAQRAYEHIKDGPDPRDVTAIQARIDAAPATLDLAHIEAPFDGTITHLDIKPGDQASPGQVVFRLDDLSRLLVDVRISEVDINRIAAGQEVHLTFDAIPGKEYQGLVSEVSKVGIASQGIVEFAVTIELTDADDRVKPGMTAAVNIVVEQLENVLLVPNRAVRVLSGQRVVYVIRNNELTQIKITLGATSDTVSEVLDGDLRLGDAVVLNPPLVFESSGPPPFVRR